MRTVIETAGIGEAINGLGRTMRPRHRPSGRVRMKLERQRYDDRPGWAWRITSADGEVLVQGWSSGTRERADRECRRAYERIVQLRSGDGVAPLSIHREQPKSRDGHRRGGYSRRQLRLSDIDADDE